jgi:hypothetical protein
VSELATLVREELAELTPLALEKDVEVVLDGYHNCLIESYPVALAVALQNLITNALNLSPPGSEVRVQVRLHRYFFNLFSASFYLRSTCYSAQHKDYLSTIYSPEHPFH